MPGKTKPPVVPPFAVTPLLPPQPTKVLKCLFLGAQLRDLQNKRQMPLQCLGPWVLHINGIYSYICIYVYIYMVQAHGFGSISMVKKVCPDQAQFMSAVAL